MKRSRIVAIAVLLIVGSYANCHGGENLQFFCGAAFKKPAEEILEVFQNKTNTTVSAVYAGTGTLFGQMLLTRQGDLFLAPAPDIMEKAVQKGLVVPGSVRGMAHVVPCINVQKGNPRHIVGLKDLLKPGTKVAIGNPEIVYIGALAVEIIEKTLTKEEKALFRNNIVTYAEDFNKLATFLVLKQVDAVIGFHYLEGWYPDKIESVKLKPNEVQRIGVSKAGILSFSKSKEAAQKFIDFLLSAESAGIFRKYHYFSSPGEAFLWLGAKKPVGGEYAVPGEWMAR